MLGLTVDLAASLRDDRLADRAGARGPADRCVVRPVLVGLVPAADPPVAGRARVRALVAGSRAPCPILLGTYVLARRGRRTPGSSTTSSFVVVLSRSSCRAAWCRPPRAVFGVPMRLAEPEPWALGMRFRDEPRGCAGTSSAPGSPADGCTLADLDVGESFWVSMVSRGGRLVQVRGDTQLQAGDERPRARPRRATIRTTCSSRRADAEPRDGYCLAMAIDEHGEQQDAGARPVARRPDHRSSGRRRQPRHLHAWSPRRSSSPSPS